MKSGRFLFIAANEGHAWGGSELLWCQAAQSLKRRGHEVSISAKQWPIRVPGVEHLRDVGCRVVYRQPPSFVARQIRRLVPEYADGVSHLKSVEGAADLVVVSQGGNWDGLAWMESSRDLGLAYVVIAQAASEHWWPEDDLAERIAAAFEGARRSYFVSQGNVGLSRLQFAIPLRNAAVVHNPFNVRYDSAPAWPSDPAAELCLACVARLDIFQKGQDLLLQVLSLPHWRKRNVRVSLIGSGPNERGLRRSTKALDLSSVDFAGFQTDIEKVWSLHHCLVLPSRFEGLSLAVVEAMLCGRPCIVTDIAGHKELVRDGVNGFLAKAPTVELLDEAMNRAWDSRGSLQAMGEQAAKDVRESVPANPAEKFATELESLVNGKEAK